MRQTEDALQAMHEAAKVQDLSTAMEALVRRLGYAGFGYLDTYRQPKSGDTAPFFVTTLRGDFVSAYMGGGLAVHDPAVARAAASNASFTWTDCPEFHINEHRRGPKTGARKVIELAHSCGYTQGLVMPVHAVDRLGGQTSALVSLFWAGSLRRFGKRDSRPWWLRLVALAFHERIVELRGVGSREPPAHESLTNRERECLAWACRGKTGDETATILGIGERTVEFHLQNAMNKLGVHSKAHAIAMAICRGLLPGL